jgi:hypothetical protein
MIKLFQLNYTTRFGRMIVITILSFKSKYALAQFYFSFDDDYGFPWLRIDCGLNQALSILLSVWRFTFEFNFLTKFYHYD